MKKMLILLTVGVLIVFAAGCTCNKDKKLPAVSTPQDEMVQAALLLVRQGQGNVSSQAINILGYLGGEKAERALLKMLESGSGNRNHQSIINALVTMRSNKLRSVIIKLLNSNNTQDVDIAINALNNRSLLIFKKLDLPLLLKVLNNMPETNNNRYRRNNLLRIICQLDQKTGVKYICDALEIADSNQQRELIYILVNQRIRLKAESMQKIIDVLGEPDSQNINAFRALCDDISRNPDIRLTDAVLPWSEFAAMDDNFRNSYLNMLYQLRDPKTANIVLDLCLNSNMRNSHYLNNFPGIIKENGKYQLVNDARMKKLLKSRAKRISRMNERDKERAARGMSPAPMYNSPRTCKSILR